jgi:hypothetical protein
LLSNKCSSGSLEKLIGDTSCGFCSPTFRFWSRYSNSTW